MSKQVDVVDVDDGDELIVRVAAIDAAKASGMVCVRVPHPSIPGRRVGRVWEVAATTNSILQLAGELVDVGVERVVIESRSDYWRPFFYLLEGAGLTVWLVNARDVKQVPGRPKTDKLDAVWLAKLNERGMLRPSFVPPAEIRVLRDYTRLRIDLVRDRTRHVQRLEKLLEDALIKLSSVVSDLMGVSSRAMLDALIAGERDPIVLAGMARGRLRVKHGELLEALTGRFDDHHGDLARILLGSIDEISRRIDGVSEHIDALLEQLPAALPPASDADGDVQSLGVIDRLDEIAGVGPRAAQIIVAEVGLDMSRFPTPGHLVSWAKLSPRTIQSGSKSRSGGTGTGNPYLKGALGEAATAAAKTDTFLGERYRRLVRRCGKRKALVAVARSILVIVWQLLADPTARYADLGSGYYDQHLNKDRKTRNLVRQLQALGHDVALTPAA